MLPCRQRPYWGSSRVELQRWAPLMLALLALLLAPAAVSGQPSLRLRQQRPFQRAPQQPQQQLHAPQEQQPRQRRLPPGLDAAQRMQDSASRHSGARAASVLQQQPWQHAPHQEGLQQQLVASPPHIMHERRRQLLNAAAAPALAEQEPAAEEPVAEAQPELTGPFAPFANYSTGNPNATGARETALRRSLLEFYDPLVFPWSDVGAAQVNVSVAIHKILGVDLYAGTMQLVVWMRILWFDPRLTWDKDEWNVTQVAFANPQQGDTEIWDPDVTLWNAAEPMLYTLGQEPLQALSNGRVFWSRPGYVNVACNFKGLSAFPFGKVKCMMELGSWAYGPWKVNVMPDSAGFTVGGSITGGETAVWTEYKISEVKAWRHTYPPYPCCPDESDWPVLLVEVTMRRQNLIYLMKVIVPQIILTAVAFTTFWLSPACGERLGLAVTVPLAVAVYDLLTFSQLPVSNKVTLVSALGMTSFLFSMAVLIENALVIQLWHYREPAYFRGLSVLAATVVAYREQLVWVGLLTIIQELKTELGRRQLAMLQRRKAVRIEAGDSLLFNTGQLVDAGLRARSRVHRRPGRSMSRSLLIPLGDGAGKGAAPEQPLGNMQQLDVALHSDQQAVPELTWQGVPLKEMSARLRARARWRVAVRSVINQNRASAAGPEARGRELSPGRLAGLRERAAAKLASELAGMEARMDLPTSKRVGAKTGTTEDLLLAATKAQLRGHIHSILASGDARLLPVQRRIRKATAVFGEDVLVGRLHAVLVGERGASHDDTSTDAGSTCDDCVAEANLHQLHVRLADDFNRRWQLMSMMIDYASRFMFILSYVVINFAIVVTLLRDES